MGKLKVALGADHGGFELKNKIAEYLRDNNIEFKDFGTFSSDSCDYPIIAKEIAIEVSKNNFNRGILVCGSGIGMAITANKIKGIRAALCWNLSTAESARTHNDSNILCLGQRQLENDLAVDMVKKWLKTDFEGGRHKKRVDMIEE